MELGCRVLQLPVLESCDPKRRVMVAFGLGVTYVLLRNSMLGVRQERQPSE